MIVIHKERDITEYVTSITWGGSKSEVARKLEIRVVNAPLDKNITPLKIGLADPLYLFDDNKKELFRGYVMEREASSSNGELSYVAYDLLYYTLKSSATYNFSKKTAEAITTEPSASTSPIVRIGILACSAASAKISVLSASDECPILALRMTA